MATTTTTMPTTTRGTTMGMLRVTAAGLAVVMVGAIVLGLLSAPEGAVAELFGNVWARVTLVDLYLALGAVWAWIAWRERSATGAVAWGVALVVTGSVALWVYVAVAAIRSTSVEQLLVGPARGSGAP